MDDTGVSFTSFHFARPIIRALSEIGLSSPTIVQKESIPLVLDNHDLICSSMTGSGKSAAFLLPILHRLLNYRGLPNPKALILSPTRELASQLHSVFLQISKYSYVKSILITGGKENEEIDGDIVIATPGRIIDVVMNQKLVSLDHIKFFVLDEADRLLSRGFSKEIETILS